MEFKINSWRANAECGNVYFVEAAGPQFDAVVVTPGRVGRFLGCFDTYEKAEQACQQHLFAELYGAKK